MRTASSTSSPFKLSSTSMDYEIVIPKLYGAEVKKERAHVGLEASSGTGNSSKNGCASLGTKRLRLRSKSLTGLRKTKSKSVGRRASVAVSYFAFIRLAGRD